MWFVKCIIQIVDKKTKQLVASIFTLMLGDNRRPSKCKVEYIAYNAIQSSALNLSRVLDRLGDVFYSNRKVNTVLYSTLLSVRPCKQPGVRKESNGMPLKALSLLSLGSVKVRDYCFKSCSFGGAEPISNLSVPRGRERLGLGWWTG